MLDQEKKEKKKALNLCFVSYLSISDMSHSPVTLGSERTMYLMSPLCHSVYSISQHCYGRMGRGKVGHTSSTKVPSQKCLAVGSR